MLLVVGGNGLQSIYNLIDRRNRLIVATRVDHTFK